MEESEEKIDQEDNAFVFFKPKKSRHIGKWWGCGPPVALDSLYNLSWIHNSSLNLSRAHSRVQGYLNI